MGLFNAIGSDGAWADPKVLVGSSPASDGPIQRSQLAAYLPAMGLFNAIGSDGAWAHAKVLLVSCPTSYGPIQCHR
jgi:hypothetical protein